MEELSVKFEMVKIVHNNWRQSSGSEQQSRNGGTFILKWYEKQKNNSIWSSWKKKEVFAFLPVYWLKLTN